MAAPLRSAPTPAPPIAADGPAPTAPARPGRAGRPGPAHLVPAGAAALAAALSWWGLGRRSAWVDEAITQGATHELVRTWRGTGGTMALYYALVTPWSWLSTDRAWLRLLSVLLAAAAVVAVWATARRLAGPRVAAVASLVAASSWLVVRYAQEARSYALVLLLSSLGWLALVATAQADAAGDEPARRRWWRLYVLVTVLAPLAHGLAVLQFLAQLGLLALHPDRSRWVARLRPVVIALAAVMSVLVVAGASDVASWIPPLNRTQVADLLHALTGPALAPALVLGLATAAGAAIAVDRRRRATDPLAGWLALVPVAWGLVPPVLLLVASVARPYLLARYVVASAPGLAVLVALAVVGTRPKLSVVRLVAVGVPVALALGLGQLDLHRDRGDDWSGAASVVADGSRPGDALVFPNPSVRSAFDVAWSEADRPEAPAAVSPVEPIGPVRRFYLVVDPARLPATIADGRSDRVWVVDQDGQGLEPTLPLLLADPALQDFTVVDDARLAGGVRVVLLERR